ncbi:MAG: hypothetical protein BGO10_01400 [Chlamydia sp. 32-24]|nr:MAG: hypothetical protein BGO10_01400 [Chlamydia sp. 32-24]
MQESNGIVIRSMNFEDIDTLANEYCFSWSTTQEIKEKWNKYYQEQQSNIRVVGVIDRKGELLGYGSLVFHSKYPHFSSIPEINDVWIHEKHRKQGLGSLLINWLERLAKEKGYKEIGIGVGLYADYGSAQKLYFRLGYIPDGHGLTYKYQPTIPGKSYPLDDELILWLRKNLNHTSS